jgi:D-alanyl-D-alanine-carboxypeptidase/D-alanyl-D-alanine-endopeptidase
MPNRRDFLIGALAWSIAASRARAQTPTDEAIRAILQERVEVAHQSVGIVAGLIHSSGRQLVTYGQSGAANGRPLDGDTVFEIGSITKVFTALLLADMVTHGEVNLSDPVARYLPAEVKVPSRGGKQITLLDLATYTSGLPRNPDNAVPKDADNPRADYTVEQLYAFLSGHTLRHDPGTRYEYANLGFGLLGHALALRAGKSYEELILSRVCKPLGLESTGISLSASMRERLAQGHNSILKPTKNWDLPTLAGAGALRSTANDLFAFLDAVTFARPDTPLRSAIEMLLKTRREAYERNVKVALGWFISLGEGNEIVWKEGGTGGYSSFIGFSLRNRQASIVLSNAGFWNNNNDIGFHLINPAHALRQYPPQVVVDAAILAKYAGTYAMSATFALTIRAEANNLFVRGTGQSEFELFAESENRFFMRSVDAQGTFLRSTDGEVRQLIWHQNGKYQYCPRVY